VSCCFLLIRHGETAWNRLGRYQGHVDTSLNRTGRAQARRLTRTFSSLQLDAIYSSDLRRAVDTAIPMAKAQGLSVMQDVRLRELHFGEWDGRQVEAIIAADPAAWEAWYSDPVHLSPPGGETALALWQRFSDGLREIGDRHRDRTVAIVTHGGPLRLLLSYLSSGDLLSLPPSGVANGDWLFFTTGWATGEVGENEHGESDWHRAGIWDVRGTAAGSARRE
jgi:alpha-ribazole phosphatase